MPCQPSASKSFVLVNCSYPFNPELEIEADVGSAAARYGSAFHEVIAECVLNALSWGKGEKPKPYDGWVTTAAGKWKVKGAEHELASHVWGSFQMLRRWMKGENPYRHDWSKDKLVVEKSYAINPSNGTSRTIDPPSEEEHQYADLLLGELPGTLDIMAMGNVKEGRPPLVLDHKTGSSKNFSSPEEDDQMKTLALIPNAGDAIVAVNHSDRQGLPVIYPGELGPVDLMTHRVQLKAAMGRIGDGSMRPGAWCSNCPAKTVCPTQYAQIVPSAVAITTAVGAIVELPGASDALTTGELVGKMHQFRSTLNAMLDKVDKEIKNYVREHPEEVVLRPDGKHLEFVTKEVERLSKTSIIEVLGKVEGEKLLNSLRKKGVLVKKPQEELRAIAD
jgi:hypothetical protein